jgi:A/G-specific adenine glycosylase
MTLIELTVDWYDGHKRDLPWRRPEAGAWGVLVSEFMLQQTPVVRVLPIYRIWLERWPKPGDLAAEPSGEAVRAWGRLGYPRRALRLHAAATAISERHGGIVPAAYDELRTLPGVGDYTAAAVASFAYGRRHAVLDTNVRRVLARACSGEQYPATSVSAAERALAESLLPEEPAAAAAWAAASMELGALICVSKSPRCETCPVAGLCAWRAAGCPEHTGPARKGQSYAGTDRQCRGALLAVLRAADAPVEAEALFAAWTADEEQRGRALRGLLEDGLAVRTAANQYSLP